MADTIRVGRISALNYPAGKARIVYTDRDEAVTKEIPLLSFEYFMPEIDDMVMVLHLPNGVEAGLCLGRAWSNKNVPPEGFKGLYRKDLSRTPGKAMIRYDDNTNELRIICSGTINIVSPSGDVLINDVSLVNHTHTCPDGETSKPN